MFNFICNICGTENSPPSLNIHREEPNCRDCGSCARFRGVVKAIQVVALDNSSIPLFAEEARDGIKCLGMSDWDGYAKELTRIFGFVNTYYHTEPYLDVTNSDSSTQYSDLDFVVSSEVLEHITAPVSAALSNIYNMLKPGGVLILTVPYLHGYETIEHFPHLDKFEIVNIQGSYSMVNKRPDGFVEHHEPLRFHGGPGSVLEMRIFGEGDLFAMLRHVGFTPQELPFDESVGYFWTETMESELWRGRYAKARVVICRK